MIIIERLCVFNKIKKKKKKNTKMGLKIAIVWMQIECIIESS